MLSEHPCRHPLVPKRGYSRGNVPQKQLPGLSLVSAGLWYKDSPSLFSPAQTFPMLLLSPHSCQGWPVHVPPCVNTSGASPVQGAPSSPLRLGAKAPQAHIQEALDSSPTSGPGACGHTRLLCAPRFLSGLCSPGLPSLSEPLLGKPPTPLRGQPGAFLTRRAQALWGSPLKDRIFPFCVRSS